MTMTRVMVAAMAVSIGSISTGSISMVEAQTKLSLSGQKRSIACGEGETVQVTGQRNTLTVTGECRKVDISGAENVVSIEAVGSIEVTGTGNEITWERAIGREAPRVSTNGAGNTITRAAAADRAPAAGSAQSSAATPTTPPAKSPGAARSAPNRETRAPSPSAPSRRPAAPTTSSGAAIKILEDGRDDAIECNGREVSIFGSRNVLDLRGACPVVIITRSDNTIDIETAQRIETTGDRNKVTWVEVGTGREPRVQNTGTQNRISKADRKSGSR